LASASATNAAGDRRVPFPAIRLNHGGHRAIRASPSTSCHVTTPRSERPIIAEFPASASDCFPFPRSSSARLPLLGGARNIQIHWIPSFGLLPYEEIRTPVVHAVAVQLPGISNSMSTLPSPWR